MDFDDIVIGSGLAALGTVMGLGAQRRVLVLGGPREGRFSHYDERQTVPSAFLGEGGLGNDWHGVIPTGWNRNFAAGRDADFTAMFEHFYPGSRVAQRLGQPWLFVPWKPIRPRAGFDALQRARGDHLVLRAELASTFRVQSNGVAVDSLGLPLRRRKSP